MSTSLKDFKEYQLYPALWNRIPEVFPDMDFKMTGGYWKSSRHLDGSPSQSPDKTFIHHRRKDLIKENGGEALSLVNFEMMRTGSDFIDALRSLADKCGLTLPDSDTEEYKAYMEKQKNREEADKRFKAALWTDIPEAAEVLDYLRNVRRFTDKEIKKAGFGYIDTQIKNGLPDSSEFGIRSVGTTHRLVIPYRNGSRLLGFKFRDIHHKNGDEGNKYMNTKGLAKSSGLFGIGCGVKDVTIMEGELDALHAIVKGADNVAATTGNEASEEQIRDAIKRGVKRFTLLFDTDEAGRKYTQKTINAIKKTSAEAYVAALPEGCKDTDEYLRDHTIEEWKTLTSLAVPSYLWEYYQVLEKFAQKAEEQDGAITYKQREDFFSEVTDILNDPSMKEQNRELIYSTMKNTEEETLFKVDDFREYADRAYIRMKDRDRKRKAEEAVGKAQELLSEGKTDEALKMMKETLSKMGTEDRGTRFAKVFTPPTPSEAASLLSEIKEGIKTGYVFSDGKHTEELELNAGLTFVCGYRGHGKTSFLNNIALNEAARNIREGSEETVLYFSYEVDKRKLMADILNTFVNDAGISAKPLETILSYFRGEDYFRKERREHDGLTHLQYFEQKKDEFFRDYISTGKLTIVDENYKVGELLDAIKFYLSVRRVSIVCIDYAQLLYSEDFTKQRTEEIKKVVNDIKDFANKEGVPFVLAAQFNRDVSSPVSVDTTNIGEGGDFERIADTVVGLYNLKELKPLPSNRSKEEADAKKLLMKLFPTRGAGEELEPMEGKLFARLLKKRYGYFPIDAVFNWTGSTKFIETNPAQREKKVKAERNAQNIMSGFVTAREEDTQEKLPF